jgi:hypothetical protein
MPLVIKDSGSVPKERWQYHVDQTDFTVEAPNWPALYPKIEEHCNSNGVPVPDLQTVIDWCCKNLSVDCFYSETKEPLLNRWKQGLPTLIQSSTCTPCV